MDASKSEEAIVLTLTSPGMHIHFVQNPIPMFPELYVPEKTVPEHTIS